MRKFFLILVNIVLVCVISITLFYIFNKKTEIFAQTNLPALDKTLNVPILEKVKEIKRAKPTEREVKGLYLTSYTASLPTKIDDFINFMKNSALNAVVIDIKDYSGVIAYDSQVDLVKELKNSRNLIKDVPGLIKKLHDNNIYVIARQTVFQDPELTGKKPAWAVQNSRTGNVWRDYKGLVWADPTNQDVWKYNLDIAKEAISLGFDEINFDYIRFPSDGPMSEMRFAGFGGKPKAYVINEFFKYLYENLKTEPAYISVDLFGLTTERTDDMNIGQQIEDAAIYFDYVCPMVYPSHYPSGYLDYKNPAEYPYQVVNHALIKGEESIKPIPNLRAKIRPWLQDFNLGAEYTPAMVDLQIKAAQEAGTFGYTLWNARNVYTYAPKN